jgi:hypothetical protein
VGELWAFEAETLRIGYGHLVQRAERIPWGHHRPAIFAAGLVVFWILSWIRYRAAAPSTALDHTYLKLSERRL